MTAPSTKLLSLLAALIVLAVAEPAAAQVQPAGTGEPLYTNSQQNTQWLEWPATSGADAYRIQYSYYANNALVANPTVSAAQRRQRLGELERRRDAAARRPVRHLRAGPVLAAQRLAVLPRRPELVLDGHAARPPRLHDDRPLQAERGGHARRAARRTPTTRPWPCRPPSPMTSPARSRRTSSASSTAASRTSATRTRGFIYGYNTGCSVPGGGGKSTTFTCTADFGAGGSPAPDGPVWACVIAADASIPDNPNGPNQSPERREGEPLRPVVRQGRARPHGADAWRSPRPRRPRSASSSPSTPRPPTPTSGLGGSYAWTWGDNTGGGSGASATHTFTQPGTYEVRADDGRRRRQQRRRDEGRHRDRAVDRRRHAGRRHDHAAARPTHGGRARRRRRRSSPSRPAAPRTRRRPRPARSTSSPRAS